MNALRQIVSSQNGQLSIDIPKEFQQKWFEIIILPIDEDLNKERIQAKMSAFLDTLPLDEPDITEADILAEIKAVRT